MKYVLEAGAIPTREPTPYTLCQGFLSKGQCGRIFPKNVTSDYKKKSGEIVALLSQLPVDQVKVDALYSVLPVLDPANSVSLRVDIAIKNPTNQKVYLLDGTFIHTSCSVYREAEFKSVVKRIEGAEAATKKNAPIPFCGTPPPLYLPKPRARLISMPP